MFFVSVDNRDCFEPWGNEKLTLLVNSELFFDFVNNHTHADMLLSCVLCAKCLSKSEINKGIEFVTLTSL